MEIIKAYFTNHPCMNRKKRSISPVGVFVHSTGAVNRELRRYVDSPERLGRNQYNNHWNKTNATKSVHAFIGKDKDGKIIVAETLPHDVACWGAGGGAKGSYNYNPHAYLQFEICEGSRTDADYYWQVIAVAEEYCAHLCKLYGWTIANITSHAEAHKAGYASNHGDPQNWMRFFGDSMDKFRLRVAMRLQGTETPSGAPEDLPAQNPVEAPTAPTEGQGDANTGSVASTEVYEMKTVRKWSKGKCVEVLQWLLSRAGYDCGDIDGVAGAKTIAAVKAYQQANGLTADGIVGRKTWAALLA